MGPATAPIIVEQCGEIIITVGITIPVCGEILTTTITVPATVE